MKFNTIEEAITDIKEGKVVIVIDDENRENEGDFVAAADKVSPHQRLLKAITEVNNITASVEEVEDKIELLNSKTIMRS